MRRIELLAPARDIDTGRTAVDFGADAIYIGGTSFGARRAAANSVEDIATLVEYAHCYGVRVYATLNTIILDSELDQAQTVAQQICRAGVDALIVQDMAFARMDLGGVALHASTQTCNTSVEGVNFLAHSGFTRIILERGLTLDQIRAIGASTDVELEAFVHGAICVGYSGQCYLSRTISTRSGNRGDCSQACRMTYDLVGEGDQTIIRGKHLLSVQDMNLALHIPQLIEAGVDSFKIEGRLKDATYIKNVVGHYRQVLDRQIALRSDLVRSSAGVSTFDFTPDPSRSFTRGGSSYFIDGKRSGVASFDTPKAMGSYVGRVTQVSASSFTIADNNLSAGDGVCFIESGQLIGTNINSAQEDRVYPNRMDGIGVGTEIYRNYDRRFVMMVEGSRTRRTIDVAAQACIEQTQIALRLTDQTGVSVELTRGGKFDVAQNPDKMLQTLCTQVSKSGDTIFNISSVNIDRANYFVPMSVINDLRREALDMLRAERLKQYERPSGGVENRDYMYFSRSIGPQMNVTNRLAEQFYKDHGAEQIEPGLDLRENDHDFDGETVMISSYCIRREIGECLLENPGIKGDLWLRRASKQYKLEFDCKRCQMSLKQIK